MITLNSDCLRVEIAEPGEHPNDGVRFDRAGFVTEVVLNNERHFCANEPKNLSHPSSGGRGFCSEFLLDVSGEAEIGQQFPKFGVGLITKEDDQEFIFHRKYKEIQHFPVKCSRSDSEAEFETEPLPCLGYAMRAWKKVRVEGNSLIMEHTVENVGEKHLTIREYCHNFVSVDGMAISPDYRIDLPNLRDFGREPFKGSGSYTKCNLIGSGHGIGFKQAEVTVSMSDVDLSGMKEEAPFRWKIEHKGAKAYVEGEDSYIPCGMVVWTADHMVSPENFNLISIAPGEKYSWSRRLTFVDLMR